jgi:UDP-N-acetylglucosamine 1-carboxyvinyltransferase
MNKKIIINGGNRLSGQLRVDGAKNSVLPILAATVLNKGISIIHECPEISDVFATMRILKYLGCKVKKENNTIIVDSSTLNRCMIPENLMREMRSSVFFIGSIISRYDTAYVSFPGGCEIGTRPIDLHLKALRKLSISIEEEHGYINCHKDKIVGNDIHLIFPSVGATENIMLASVFAEGETIIRNSAREPEIVDLQNFLNAMGCKISGAGSELIRIEGVKKLHDVEYTVIPDRVVAATYLTAAAITNGEVELVNVIPDHIRSVLYVLNDCNCDIMVGNNSITLKGGKKILPADFIRTLPYPGFPTDMQAQIMSLLSIAEGTSIISETIFENRFKHVVELLRMGANINVEGRVAVIKGVPRLTGTSLNATDLRGGAALVIAGLAAEGTTIIDHIYHIDRGYEKIEEKLLSIGADIKRME